MLVSIETQPLHIHFVMIIVAFTYRSQHGHRIYANQLAVSNCDADNTNVNHPPNPSTETCKPLLPTRRYSIPVFLGSGHDILTLKKSRKPAEKILIVKIRYKMVWDLVVVHKRGI